MPYLECIEEIRSAEVIASNAGMFTIFLSDEHVHLEVVKSLHGSSVAIHGEDETRNKAITEIVVALDLLLLLLLEAWGDDKLSCLIL